MFHIRKNYHNNNLIILYTDECGPFRVPSRPCPRSVREVSEGRYLEVNFKLQCSYLHFFRGHFADRGVNGHEMELSLHR